MLEELTKEEKAILRNEKFRSYQDNKDAKNISIKIIEQLAGTFNADELIISYASIIRKSEETIVCTTREAATTELMLFNYFKVELKTEFDCIYLKTNKAWVSESHDGKHRYFSKNKETSDYFSLSIVDMFRILYNCDFSKALSAAMLFTNIETEEIKWQDEQKEKYAYNLNLLTLNIETLEKYSNLSRFITSNLSVLEYLNIIGMSRVHSIQNKVDGENIFFSSISHISKKFDATDSYVSKIVNMYAVLGLLCKVSENKIPEYLYSRAKDEVKNKKWKCLVTFYTVPLYAENVLKEANRRAGILYQKKIRIANISDKSIQETLGREIADEVFGNSRLQLQKKLISV